MSANKYELRKQIKSVRWMIFWVVLVMFASQLVVEAAVSFMASPPHEYIRIALIELVSIGVPIMIYAKTVYVGSGKKIKRQVCLNKCTPGWILFSAFLGVTGQFVMMILNVPASYILNSLKMLPASSPIPPPIEHSEVALGIISVVLIPAILEEFLLRGIIFSTYNRCNTRGAVAFTALIFALLHLSVGEFVGFLFMGIISAMILIKSGSLYGAMIYHAFSNLTALLFGTRIMPVIGDYVWVAFGLFTVLFIGGIFVLSNQKNRLKTARVFDSASIVITSLFSVPVLASVGVVVVKYFLLNKAG